MSDKNRAWDLTIPRDSAHRKTTAALTTGRPREVKYEEWLRG